MAVDHPAGPSFAVEVLWDAIYVDITDDVRAVNVQFCQRNRLSNTFDAGRATIQVSNTDRKYDPTYTSGTYYGYLKPGRHVQIRVDGSLVWYGKLDRFTIDYIGSNHDSTVTFHCLDALGEIAQTVCPAGTTPAFQTGDRSAQWANRFESIPGNSSTIDRAGYASYISFSAECSAQEAWDATADHRIIDEIKKASDLEQGPMLADGGVYLHPRNWWTLRTNSTTVQQYLGDGGLPVHDVQVLWDADEIITAVSMTDIAGNAVVSIDTAGETTYGTRYPSSSYSALPARHIEDLESAANAVIELRATESFRIESLTVKPGSSASWPAALASLTLLDRVNVVFTPTGVGSEIDADYFIDGITHQITPGDWTTTYSLWPAAPFDAAMGGDIFIVDSSLVDGSDLVGL